LGFSGNPGLNLSPGQQTTIFIPFFENTVPGPTPPFSLGQGTLLIPLLLERTAGDAALSNLQFGGGFALFGASPSVSPSSALFQAFAVSPFVFDLGNGQKGTTVASVTMTMGNSATSTFRISVPNNFAFFNALQPTPNQPVFVGSGSSLTFTAVPEPGSMALVSVIAVVLGFWRLGRFDRRLKATSI